jgi:hypothetical protein
VSLFVREPDLIFRPIHDLWVVDFVSMGKESTNQIELKSRLRSGQFLINQPNSEEIPHMSHSNHHLTFPTSLTIWPPQFAPQPTEISLTARSRMKCHWVHGTAVAMQR